MKGADRRFAGGMHVRVCSPSGGSADRKHHRLQGRSPWPEEKPPGGEWAAMSRVVVAPDGNVWTFNAYSPDGNLVKYFGRASPAPSRIPHGRLDKAGGLWLVDPRTHTIRKFTCGGEVPLTVGTPDESGEDATQLNQPNDVTQRRHPTTSPNDVTQRRRPSARARKLVGYPGLRPAAATGGVPQRSSRSRSRRFCR